jgi:hypothetical protein
LIADAARKGLDPSILVGTRPVLQPPAPGSRGGSGAGGWSGGSHRHRREAEIVGDIGEALLHEWLRSVLDDYGSHCWVSKARERYGVPGSGNDGLGYDFRIPDPAGVLFGVSANAFHLEVKATSTDGRFAFPMSAAEWNEARRCHEANDGTNYVIVRVINALDAPRIGDVIVDPFGAHRRGEVRLAERDLWVTVSQRAPLSKTTEL